MYHLKSKTKYPFFYIIYSEYVYSDSFTFWLNICVFNHEWEQMVSSGILSAIIITCVTKTFVYRNSKGCIPVLYHIINLSQVQLSNILKHKHLASTDSHRKQINIYIETCVYKSNSIYSIYSGVILLKMSIYVILVCSCL